MTSPPASWATHTLLVLKNAPHCWTLNQHKKNPFTDGGVVHRYASATAETLLEGKQKQELCSRIKQIAMSASSATKKSEIWTRACPAVWVVDESADMWDDAQLLVSVRVFNTDQKTCCGDLVGVTALQTSTREEDVQADQWAPPRACETPIHSSPGLNPGRTSQSSNVAEQKVEELNLRGKKWTSKTVQLRCYLLSVKKNGWDCWVKFKLQASSTLFYFSEVEHFYFTFLLFFSGFETWALLLFSKWKKVLHISSLTAHHTVMINVVLKLLNCAEFLWFDRLLMQLLWVHE